MKTLKEQIENRVSDFNPFQSECNQECEILDTVFKNGIEILLVNFNSNGNPSQLTGLRVVAIEEDYIYDINSDDVKHVFNK